MKRRTICLYFQVHQPIRLRQYRIFDIGKNSDYYDDFANRLYTRKIADRCYLPANRILLDLIAKFGKNFKVSFSITGLAIEQFRKYAPDVIDSFKELAATGCVEFLGETYSHSLASVENEKEFRYQVSLHEDLMQELFGVKPVSFRNTELVYSDKIGDIVADMGYTAMLTEGARHILGWKSPNYVYTNSIQPKLKLLLRNFRLSDDLAFRFSDRDWNQWPLTADKYASWLNNADGEIVNLFMDYETFGEHQVADTGIFDFLANLPENVFASTDFEFLTASEAAIKHQPIAPLHVPYAISWADEERDLTAWLGNELQNEAHEEMYATLEKVLYLKDEDLLRDFNYLQASDHFYYMCTKLFSDGVIHKYFTPYETPYEAFINYMNVLNDFILRVDKLYEQKQAQATDSKSEKLSKSAKSAKTVKQTKADKSDKADKKEKHNKSKK